MLIRRGLKRRGLKTHGSSVVLKRRGLKRHGSSVVLKRHRSSVELLPHDVVELILERLPVEPLLRFRSVSKKWKSTIDTRRFQERQLIRRMQSRGPDVRIVALNLYGDYGLDTETRRFVFGSSIAYTFRFPTRGSLLCNGSCDGLLCVFNVYVVTPNVVANPATRWHQSFPLSCIQQLLVERIKKGRVGPPAPKLGFGKDKLRGTYKPVFLYNSSGYGLDNTTTCEVFDFSTNAWRYVVPASPYRTNPIPHPVYFDGSLYWLTDCEETKVLSFDLHTETFQVICQAPFAHPSDPRHLTMCILDNRLCVSQTNWPTQEIWSFHDSSGGNKTWKKMCSIDLTMTFSWFGEPRFALSPIAILDKNKLLLQGRDYHDPVVRHDLHTKSYDLLFKPTNFEAPVYYLQSLFSAFAN